MSLCERSSALNASTGKETSPNVRCPRQLARVFNARRAVFFFARAMPVSSHLPSGHRSQAGARERCPLTSCAAPCSAFAVALVTLAGLGGRLCGAAAVLAERAADVIAFLEAALGVAAHEALVGAGVD